jgi:hypothetical protein
MTDQPEILTNDPAQRSHCKKWWTVAQKRLLQKLDDEGVPWSERARQCGHTEASCRTTLRNMQDRRVEQNAAGKPVISRQPWTEQEVKRLIEAREIDGLSFREIDAELKRPFNCSYQKYKSLRRPAARSFISRDARVEIDKTAFEARDARKLAEMRQSETSRLLGEPPPGYSALDRKRSGAQP